MVSRPILLYSTISWGPRRCSARRHLVTEAKTSRAKQMKELCTWPEEVAWDEEEEVAIRLTVRNVNNGCNSVRALCLANLPRGALKTTGGIEVVPDGVDVRFSCELNVVQCSFSSIMLLTVIAYIH